MPRLVIEGKQLRISEGKTFFGEMLACWGWHGFLVVTLSLPTTPSLYHLVGGLESYCDFELKSKSLPFFMIISRYEHLFAGMLVSNFLFG